MMNDMLIGKNKYPNTPYCHQPQKNIQWQDMQQAKTTQMHTGLYWKNLK